LGGGLKEVTLLRKLFETPAELNETRWTDELPEWLNGEENAGLNVR
jgi:hypothetical protein